MAVFEVEANGRRFEVEAPDMQTAMGALGKAGPDFDFAGPTPTADQRPQLDAALNRKALDAGPTSSVIDPLAQGLTFGFADEILGGAMGVAAMAKGKSFGAGYEPTVKALRGSLEAERRRHPIRSAAVEIAGALPTVALPMGQIARGAGLGTKMLQGAKAGAVYGGLYGTGASEGSGEGGPVADLLNTNRLQGAGIGAGTGFVTGGALPLAVAGAKSVASPFINAVRARVDPSGYAAMKVADRLASQGGMTPNRAAQRISRAAAQGQRMTLADVGGSDVRDLARTAVNIPGPARNRTIAKVNIAQMSQGARLKRAIGNLFADPDAYQATKEGIIAARASAAEPYYRAAYGRPVPYTRDLEGLLATPAGKRALAGAKVNSANRREPWAQWFANVADDGTITDIRRVPDTRALDEVKRTLDQMVEAAKVKPDGSPFARPRHTAESLAIKSVRDDLLSIVDNANPAYANARRIAMDNIQADDALEFGRKALNTDARAVAKGMAGLTGGQKELARIGAAEALRDKIDRAGMTHNAVLRIFNSREQIKGLRALFGDTTEFNRFRSFIFNEARRSQTRAAVTGNSTTAKQLADMAEAGDLASKVEVAHNAVMWGPVAAILQAAQSGLRRLGGLTPKVADEIAKRLMSSDPATVQRILTQIRAIEASQASAEVRNSAIRSLLTRLVAGQEGRTLAPQPSPRTVAR